MHANMNGHLTGDSTGFGGKDILELWHVSWDSWRFGKSESLPGKWLSRLVSGTIPQSIQEISRTVTQLVNVNFLPINFWFNFHQTSYHSITHRPRC
jgi:hypothetical protein